MRKRIISILAISLFLTILAGCTTNYTVSFESMGGSEVSPVSVEEGNIVDVPSTSREGYTFDGWYTSLDSGETLSDEWVFSVNPVTRDLTLYAKWEANEYNLKAYDYYGLEIYDENIKTDTNLESIIDSINTYREGLTFEGWDIAVPETMPAKDLVLNGQYTTNSYSVIFVDYDGEVLQTNNYFFRESLSDLSFPQDLVREGHIFDGWISDFTLTDIFTRSMPNHDIIIHAEYTQILTIEELVTNQSEYIGRNVTVTGTISSKVGRHGYIQEGNFGVYIYTGFEYTTKFQIGNTVILHDVVPTYYPDQETGALQLSGFRARNLEVLSEGNFVEPNLISINDLTDEMIGSLVEVHQLTIVDVYAGQNGAFTVYTEDEFGHSLVLKKDASSSEDILITEFTVGKVLNIVGPVHVINSEKVIMITTNDDVTFID